MGAQLVEILKTERWFGGEDKIIPINLLQADGVTAQSGTGWTLTFQIMTGKNGRVLVTKTIGSGIVLSNDDDTDDLATVTIDAVDTVNWREGSYYITLQRDNASSITDLTVGDAYIHSHS